MNNIEKTVPEAATPDTPSQEVTRQPDRYALPPVDIYEEGDHLVVLADLPGVRKDGLLVQVEQGVLTIEGRVDRDTPGG
ncbi:MAG: Hsp20/alpha crystallin family protein, partial [Deferrisomatales bacterium]